MLVNMKFIFRVEQDISLVHFAHSWHTLSYFRTFMYYSLYNNLGSANIEPLDKYMSNLLLLLIFLISLLLICCLINFLLNLFLWPRRCSSPDLLKRLSSAVWAEVNVKKQISLPNGIGNTVLIKMGLKKSIN